jgi:hypothetical protein
MNPLLDDKCSIASVKPQQLTNCRPLNYRLCKRLLAYVVAAGAGATTSVVAAKAEVVYTPILTNIHTNFDLDLDHDGINDFHLYSYYLSLTGVVQVTPLITGNRVVETPTECYREAGAAPLRAGAVIGPGMPFRSGVQCLVALNFSTYGPWLGARDRFLGFSFLIEGQQHFGWARMSIHGFYPVCFGCVAGITGYAYETIPGKPIVAGDMGLDTKAELKPLTLGMLALGSLGLELWRKEDGAER